MKHAIIRICTEEPDHSDIQKSSTIGRTHVTGEPKKKYLTMPPPLGKRVVFTAFVDANLYHDLISGSRSQGIIHCANQTIIEFFSKQSTVETATFVQNTLQPGHARNRSSISVPPSATLGVPIEHATVMLGDNESVVNTASMPHSKLNKRHNCLLIIKRDRALLARYYDFPISLDQQIRPIFSVNTTWRVFGRLCVLLFALERKEDPAH
jgi:hypothetical protein